MRISLQLELLRALIALKDADRSASPSQFLENCVAAIDAIAEDFVLDNDQWKTVNEIQKIGRADGYAFAPLFTAVRALNVLLANTPGVDPVDESLPSVHTIYLDRMRDKIFQLVAARREQVTRISIANIANYAEVAGTRYIVGMLNKGSLLKGKLVYTALGGAAKMTSAGWQTLGAAIVPEGDDDDARFFTLHGGVEKILTLLAGRDPSLIEGSADREVEEEFVVPELPGQHHALLSSSEAGLIAGVYRTTIIQRPADATDNNSARDGGDATYRMFFMHDLSMPQSVLDSLLQCERINGAPIFRVLTLAEVQARATAEGIKIGGNILTY